MKTIFLSFSLKKSSVSEFFLEVAHQLHPKYKVVIITYGDTQHSYQISPDIKIFKWPSDRPNGLKDFGFLLKLIKQYRPHIMIANFGAVNMFLMVGYLLGVSHRIAWYRTLTDQLENKKILKFRKKMFYKMGTQIIANSLATKNDLIANFKVEEKKINVVYNAVRDPELKAAIIEKNKILYVGRMEEIKGISVLIEAIPLVLNKFPQTEFVFVGGNLKSAAIIGYINKSKALGIEGNVRFTGNKGKNDVLKEFSTAYFSVVPSLVEAFGYVVIESFSVKTPVIGSNTTGISEIIRNNVDGLLFEPKNSLDFAEKMILLLEDENLRNNFSKNCYQRFREEFELKIAVENLVKTLENKLS